MPGQFLDLLGLLYYGVVDRKNIRWGAVAHAFNIFYTTKGTLIIQKLTSCNMIYRSKDIVHPHIWLNGAQG